jgi:hypothetical protein
MYIHHQVRRSNAEIKGQLPKALRKMDLLCLPPEPTFHLAFVHLQLPQIAAKMTVETGKFCIAVQLKVLLRPELPNLHLPVVVDASTTSMRQGMVLPWMRLYAFGVLAKATTPTEA